MISYSNDDNTGQFNDAAVRIRTLTKRPLDDELLLLYALYKQGTIGNNITDQPGMFDFKAKAKWNSWSKHRGKSKITARKEYITLVNTLLDKYIES